MPGTYDRDHDRIVCTACDWADYGVGPTAAAWAIADHDQAAHPHGVADECPAGGAHTWELHEEWGTGRTGMACAECHAPMPRHDHPDY